MSSDKNPIGNVGRECRKGATNTMSKKSDAAVGVLPMRFYGDPVECVDELRRLNEMAMRKAEQDRKHKGRRIRALVKRVMLNGGAR